MVDPAILRPGATIGILGGGQLGRMLVLAAARLGFKCHIYAPPGDNPAFDVAHAHTAAGYDDEDRLEAFARAVDVATYEFENVPVETARFIARHTDVAPGPAVLEVTQDRLHEKTFLRDLGIEVPAFAQVSDLGELTRAVETLGRPSVLKTRRLGYDGKGQLTLDRRDDLPDACSQLGGRDLIAEQWVDFDCEVSALGVRSVDGKIAFYPLTLNEHTDGVLRVSRAPVEIPGLTECAQGYMRRLLEDLSYVGVLALEFFVVGGTLLANEFAPRVHNSGHWTIEGSRTSQFANHIRAITGQSPGSTASYGHAGMINLIGKIPAGARQLQRNHCWLHDYGKHPRQGRKLGHINVVATTAFERDQQIAQISEIVT